MKAYDLLEAAYCSGRKLLVCGNGGSASDSEHIVGELMKEFKLKRRVYSEHAAALKAIERNCGLAIYNLGTGHGYSVLNVVNAFMKVNHVNVPYVIMPRRPGDIATCYSDPAKAERELGWKAQYGLDDMCRDSWNWQKNNPEGY